MTALNQSPSFCAWIAFVKYFWRFGWKAAYDTSFYFENRYDFDFDKLRCLEAARSNRSLNVLSDRSSIEVFTTENESSFILLSELFRLWSRLPSKLLHLLSYEELACERHFASSLFTCSPVSAFLIVKLEVLLLVFI